MSRHLRTDSSGLDGLMCCALYVWQPLLDCLLQVVAVQQLLCLHSPPHFAALLQIAAVRRVLAMFQHNNLDDQGLLWLLLALHVVHCT